MDDPSQGRRSPSPEERKQSTSARPQSPLSPMSPTRRASSPSLALTPMQQQQSGGPATAELSPMLGSLPPEPPPSLAPGPATIRKLTVEGTDYYAHEGADAKGNEYFKPLNPETQRFSRYPHIAREASGKIHATDIHQGVVSSLDLGAKGTLSELRPQKKKKKPVPLEDVDAQDRRLYARDKTAERSGVTEPLSPRTQKHIAEMKPHRLLNATPSAIESHPTTPELRQATLSTAEPFVPDSSKRVAAPAREKSTSAPPPPSSPRGRGFAPAPSAPSSRGGVAPPLQPSRGRGTAPPPDGPPSRGGPALRGGPPSRGTPAPRGGPSPRGGPPSRGAPPSRGGPGPRGGSTSSRGPNQDK